MFTGAYPKTLGFVKASFRVLTDIPEHLRAGVFAHPGKSFHAWLRFSNSANGIFPDTKPDIRGLSMKLLGVEGARYSDDEQQTQDFLMLSYPVMPFGTLGLFRDAVYYGAKGCMMGLVAKLMFTGRGNVLSTLKKAKQTPTSPLDIPYWSAAPFRLGNNAMKYKIVPTSTYRSQMPASPSDNYLTENMAKHLSSQVATFDFYVQLYKDEATTPIEDATIEWKEADSPFIKVAQIEIPVQTFDTPARREMALTLTYSPGNALADHEPIGAINRVRVQLNYALLKYRINRQARTFIEPKAEDFDAIP